MKNQSNNSSMDFNLDFSSNSSGEIASLESFLEDTDLVDNKSNNIVNDGIDLNDIKTSSNAEPSNEPQSDEPQSDEPQSDEPQSDEPQSDEPQSDVTPSNTGKDGAINYKDIITDLIKSNTLDSIEAFETDEGEIAFDDMDIDRDTFIDILKQHEEDLKSKYTKDKISTEDISDFTKKLIEIDKNGGDVKQALDSYNTYKNPLDKLDLTNKQDQQTAIYLKLQAKGLDDKSIADVIKAYDIGGNLQEKAEEAVADLDNAFNEHLKSIEEEAKSRKLKMAEALKVYKTQLKSNISKFELKDSYKNKIVELATKPDKNGRFGIDEIYSEIRQDPDKAADLVLFLTDKDEYIKQITNKVKKDTNISTMKKMKLIRRGGSSVSIKTDNKVKDSNKYIDLEKVIN